MCGYGRIRGKTLGRLVLLASTGCAVAAAQPTISSLQSAILPGAIPANITSVTSGSWSNQANGFVLYINGNFLAGGAQVTWTNISGGPSSELPLFGPPTTTQISALVNPNLYNNTV